MKKIVLSCVILGTLAFGNSATRSERIHTMNELESAMGMIQKGFLRNNATIVKLGTTNLKENLKNIDSFLIEGSVNNKNFNPKVYAVTESEAITKLANEILKNFEEGKNNESRDAYNKALSRCLSCHKIIRKW